MTIFGKTQLSITLQKKSSVEDLYVNIFGFQISWAEHWSFPFPGLSLVLSGSILLVRLIGFPESRVESKDAQENFAAVGDREPALAQASIPIICFLL